MVHQKQVQSQQQDTKTLNVPLLLSFPDISSIESLTNRMSQQQQQSPMTTSTSAVSVDSHLQSSNAQAQLNSNHQIYQKLVDVLMNNSNGGGSSPSLLVSNSAKQPANDLYTQQLKQNLAN